MLLGGRRRSACTSYGELNGARGGQGQAQLARQPRLTGRACGHCGAAAERFPWRLGGGTAGRRPEWADGGGNWVPPRVNGGWNSPPPTHQGNRRRLGHDSPAGRERRQRLGRGPPAPPRRRSWTPPPQEGRRRLVTLCQGAMGRDNRASTAAGAEPPRASGAEAAAGTRSPRATEAAVMDMAMDPAAPGGQTAVGDPMGGEVTVRRRRLGHGSPARQERRRRLELGSPARQGSRRRLEPGSPARRRRRSRTAPPP